jgi:hypothetical protein
MINFKVTRDEAKTIRNIVQRATAVAVEACIDYKALDIDMDITACHANGCRLKLEELAKADNFNFSHDIFGIRRHLNRETGQLEDCFLPRFAEPE